MSSDAMGFQRAKDLAEQLYGLQLKQADHMLALLTEQGKTLSVLVTKVAVVETKLDAALELHDKVEELSNDLNKVKGAGILGGIILAVAELGIAIWAAVHGKN